MRTDSVEPPAYDTATMDILTSLLVIVGGVLAISALIIAKQPEAKRYLDKLLPFQALIGVGMLVLGVLFFLRSLPTVFSLIKAVPLHGISVVVMCLCGVLLGFVFGMVQIAKWLPGHPSAEQRGQELIQKILPYQILLGIGGIGASVIYLLYRFNLMNGQT